MCTNSAESYGITKRLKTPKEVEKYFPAGFLAFIDCTIEQQIPTRPVDKNRRKIFYSGKKKKHTIKNQITVNNRGYILHKVCYKKGGRKHDYNIYKKIIPEQLNKLLM